MTIAGQSAGAVACIYLLTISQAKGLFRQVIAVSGSVGVGLTPAKAEFAANVFRTIIGLTDDGGVLAQVPITAVIAAQTRVSGGDAAERSASGSSERLANGFRFLPVIDGGLRELAGTDTPVALSSQSKNSIFFRAMPPHSIPNRHAVLGLAMSDRLCR